MRKLLLISTVIASLTGERLVLADTGDQAAAQKYDADADKLLAKGDFKSADIQLKNAVKADPANPARRIKLAEVDIRLNDIDSAQVELKAAREHGGDESRIVWLLGRTYLLQGKFEQLLNDFPVDDKASPATRAVTLTVRAEAQIQLRHIDDARTSLTAAVELQPQAAEPKLALARIAFTQGRYDEAEKLAESIVQISPTADGHLLKGDILNRKGDKTGAMAEFDQAIKTEPNNVAGYIERAQIFLAQNQRDKAEADVKTALSIAPNSIAARYFQALLLTDKQDYQGADAILSKDAPAFQGFPRGYYLQAVVKSALNQYEQAQKAITAFLAALPDDVGGEKVLASIMLKKADPAAAVDTLEKVVAQAPGDAQAFGMLGDAYTQLRQPPRAIEAFERAAKLAPDNAAYVRGLALNHLSTGQVAQGRQELEKALQMQPDDVSSGEALVMVELREKDYAHAQTLVDDMRKRRPDDPVPANMSGLVQLAQQRLPEAEAAYRETTQKFPGFLPAKIQLASVYATEGKRDQARDVYQDIIDRDPVNLQALQNLSGLLMATKQVDATVSLWQKAHLAQPDNVPVALGLIQALILKKDVDGGLSLVRDMQLRQPNEPRLYAMKAQLENQKDPKAAVATLQRLTELQPQDPAARRDLALVLDRTGNLPEAINQMAEARKLDPGNISLAAEEVTLLGKRNPEDGIAAAQRLAAQMPDQPQAQVVEGDYLVSLRRPADSLAAYQRAYQAHPSVILAERLASSYLRDGKPALAEKALNDWQSAHPDDLAGKFALANFSLGQKDSKNAKQRYEAILKERPADPLVLNNLAYLYQQDGDPRALDYARKAHDAAPENGPIADTLGWILVRQADPAGGLKLLQQAHDAAPNDLDVQYHLAFALDTAGKKTEATELLKQAIAAGRDFDSKKDAQVLLDRLSKT